MKEWNEDWEEEDPDIDKGPFDHSLIYGEDGPDFKCGDRVQYIDNCGKIDFHWLKNKTATIVYYRENFGDYVICFDENIHGWGHLKYNIPHGHGWSFNKKIERYEKI